jgi:hypothetical protein
VTVTSCGCSSRRARSGHAPVPRGLVIWTAFRGLRFQAMERYVLSGGRQGYDRLRVLAAARRASTLELFRLAGLRPGMRCADLGCGSGDVTF